jgi:hypothetical protein
MIDREALANLLEEISEKFDVCADLAVEAKEATTETEKKAYTLLIRDFLWETQRATGAVLMYLMDCGEAYPPVLGRKDAESRPPSPSPATA